MLLQLPQPRLQVPQQYCVNPSTFRRASVLLPRASSLAKQ